MTRCILCGLPATGTILLHLIMQKCICNLCSHWEENQIWKKTDIKAQMDEPDHYYNDDEMIPRILVDAMYNHLLITELSLKDHS